ncbi:hypothetical protein GCM10010401_07210 [Rarobacter faecitabidus]|uniref:Uncharacterized protein n=1 Tax=Rarobacter faecitabidus TaxID=13243 RepID=A0A542Z862_RARFA|nr:hypothetical protein FB461_2412 [Rarobacter faecitabidus]
MSTRTIKATENLPQHLRSLARSVAYTGGHAAVFRAAADEIERLRRQVETVRALQETVHVCVIDEERV